MKGVCAVPTLLPARHIQAIAGNSWPGEELITAHTSACRARYWVSNGAGTVPNCCCNGASPRRASSFPSGDPASNSSRTPTCSPGMEKQQPCQAHQPDELPEICNGPRDRSLPPPHVGLRTGARAAPCGSRAGWNKRFRYLSKLTRAEPRIPLLLEDRHAR